MNTTTYHRLTLVEREQISQGIWAQESFAQVAERIKFDVSCVSREVGKNTGRRGWYSAVKAQANAEANNKKRGRKKKIDTSERIKNYVYENLKQEWSPEESLEILHAIRKILRISH
mgnify:CR=1 FL=1